LHKNLNVLPRMYSFGCWRSFRIPLLSIVNVASICV
jgi:hypothetical protein